MIQTLELNNYLVDGSLDINHLIKIFYTEFGLENADYYTDILGMPVFIDDSFLYRKNGRPKINSNPDHDGKYIRVFALTFINPDEIWLNSKNRIYTKTWQINIKRNITSIGFLSFKANSWAISTAYIPSVDNVDFARNPIYIKNKISSGINLFKKGGYLRSS